MFWMEMKEKKREFGYFYALGMMFDENSSGYMGFNIADMDVLCILYG